MEYTRSIKVIGIYRLVELRCCSLCDKLTRLSRCRIHQLKLMQPCKKVVNLSWGRSLNLQFKLLTMRCEELAYQKFWLSPSHWYDRYFFRGRRPTWDQYWSFLESESPVAPKAIMITCYFQRCQIISNVWSHLKQCTLVRCWQITVRVLINLRNRYWHITGIKK